MKGRWLAEHASPFAAAAPPAAAPTKERERGGVVDS